MARCPTCGGTFEGASFCPRDGSRLVVERESKLLGGRYRIARKIGEGGMGEVFQAEHAFTHRTVAVKLLKHAVMSDPSASVRLQREAQLVTGLDHPNIVDVLDFGFADDGQAYLVMEWLDGETLDNRLQRERLDVETALVIAAQTCAGLAEAHARGVVHRDLKPANLFLTTDRHGRMHVKVLDFGIAKLGTEATKLTGTGVLVGTPFYMSPEQATGDPVDGRTDVYSLGVILYEMLTGTPPFRGDSAMAILHQITTRPPEPLAMRAPDRTIPEHVAGIVLRCLEKHPDDRYASMLELATVLERRASVPRIEPRRPRVEADVDDALPAPSRRLWPWIVAGLALAAVGVAAVVMLRGDVATTRSTRSIDAGLPVIDANVIAVDAVTVDAKDVRTIAGRADHFTFTVRVSPAGPAPDRPFEIGIELHGLPPRLADGLTAGKVIARLSLRNATTRGALFDARHPVGDDGHAHFVTSLHAIVPLRADLELWLDGRELEHASFDLFEN